MGRPQSKKADRGHRRPGYRLQHRHDIMWIKPGYIHQCISMHLDREEAEVELLRLEDIGTRLPLYVRTTRLWMKGDEDTVAKKNGPLKQINVYLTQKEWKALESLARKLSIPVRILVKERILRSISGVPEVV